MIFQISLLLIWVAQKVQFMEANSKFTFMEFSKVQAKLWPRVYQSTEFRLQTNFWFLQPALISSTWLWWPQCSTMRSLVSKRQNVLCSPITASASNRGLAGIVPRLLPSVSSMIGARWSSVRPFFALDSQPIRIFERIGWSLRRSQFRGLGFEVQTDQCLKAISAKIKTRLETPVWLVSQ